MKKSWRRGKHVKELNTENVRFSPSSLWEEERDRERFMILFGKKNKGAGEMISECKSIHKAIDIIAEWATKGI